MGKHIKTITERGVRVDIFENKHKGKSFTVIQIAKYPILHQRIYLNKYELESLIKILKKIKIK